MPETLQEALARRAGDEPSWVHAGAVEATPEAGAAERLLAGADDDDRGILALAYGFGLDLGTIAYALRLDPAVVSWKLQQLVGSGDESTGAARRESALAAWARSSAGAGPRRADALVDALPEDARRRLLARLQHAEGAGRPRARGGLGIGVVFIVILAALAFMTYGAVLDINPMWRGQDLVRRGAYTKARAAFSLLGSEPEARRWIAIAWLAEGEFSRALLELDDPAVAEWFGDYRPIDPPFPPVDVDPESGALLPRGLVIHSRPTFLYRAGAPGSLRLEIIGSNRVVSMPLPPADEGQIVALEYPEDVKPLPSGSYIWSVPGAPGEPDQQAAFELIDAQARRQMNREATERLSNLPQSARLFLRGQSFLRGGIYGRAGHEFAALSRRFPAQAYPQAMLEEIGRALGVDPEVLLR